MILSGSELKKRYNEGEFDVEPEPKEAQFQPASFDVRISNQLVDVWADKEQERLRLYPDIFYLGSTEEYIKMPSDVAAILTGRSTVGRKGITVHCTAGFIDPGFEGTVTLEMFNFSETPVDFSPGDRIGQLIFFEVKNPCEKYDGQYQEQNGVTKAGNI